MSKNNRKRRFIIESDTDSNDGDDQLLVNKKCRRICESDTEDSGGDENRHQSHPLILRSPRSLEDDDGSSSSSRLYVDTEPNSPQSSFVEDETASCRIQERPINYCFLRDLSSPTSKYVTDYHENKQELASCLYEFYNQTVFENQLPASMDISWNKRLRRIAGRTGFRENNGDRYAIIQLLDKVCDSAERLRDTLIHEMCHAACWLIDGDREYAHGLLWQHYCDKAAETLPELPEITVYHNWEIHYTVIYQCSGCHARLGRWTESLNTEKSVCRFCHSKMVLVNS